MTRTQNVQNNFRKHLTTSAVPVTEFLRRAAPSVFALKAVVIQLKSIILPETRTIFDNQFQQFLHPIDNVFLAS